MDSSPSPSYSLTLRIEYPNSLGMLGRITSLIGQMGGDIGAIDIVQSAPRVMQRDITFSARDVEHGRHIIAEVRELEGVDVVNVSDRTFLMHLGGKLAIRPKNPIKTRDDLSILYTPGVVRVVQHLIEEPEDVWSYTIKKNAVAVVSDGSETLGLGDTGPEAVLPVLESKAILLKEFAGVDAFPLPLRVNGDDEFVAALKAVAPTFGAIHLEDIKAPRCFRLEKRLEQELDIPVFHNDQHGTAIVSLAALTNAFRLLERHPGTQKVVINGAEAAGIATARLLMAFGVGEVVVCDDQGTLGAFRSDLEDETLIEIARNTNPQGVRGDIRAALRGADALVGFGRRPVLELDDLRAMNSEPIVFAMANPYPEIAFEGIEQFARVVATGKSEFPNQINNMLAFPGVLRGLLDARATSVNDAMRLAAAAAIAGAVGIENLHEDYIIPSVFDRRVAGVVANAVREAARKTGAARESVRSL